MSDPIAQLRQQCWQLAAIRIQTVLHLFRNGAIQVLGHMATEHAGVRVYGDMNLFRAQAGRQHGHRQNSWCALQIN